MFKSEEKVSSDNRRPLHRTANANAGNGQVNQPNIADQDIFSDGGQLRFLANVAGTIAQNSAPYDLQTVGRVTQTHFNLPTAKPRSELRCVWIGCKFLHTGRSSDSHLR